MKGFLGTLKNSLDSKERDLSSGEFSKEKSNLSSVSLKKGDLTSKDSLETKRGLEALVGDEERLGAAGRGLWAAGRDLGAAGRGLDGAE